MGDDPATAWCEMMMYLPLLLGDHECVPSRSSWGMGSVVRLCKEFSTRARSSARLSLGSYRYGGHMESSPAREETSLNAVRNTGKQV